jgi:hypothetical protein
LKEVRKAAKKAKTFETQKLVKKLKQLRYHHHFTTLFLLHGSSITGQKLAMKRKSRI